MTIGSFWKHQTRTTRFARGGMSQAGAPEQSFPPASSSPGLSSSPKKGSQAVRRVVPNVEPLEDWLQAHPGPIPEVTGYYQVYRYLKILLGWEEMQLKSLPEAYSAAQRPLPEAGLIPHFLLVGRSPSTAGFECVWSVQKDETLQIHQFQLLSEDILSVLNTEDDSLGLESLLLCVRDDESTLSFYRLRSGIHRKIQEDAIESDTAED